MSRRDRESEDLPDDDRPRQRRPAPLGWLHEKNFGLPVWAWLLGLVGVMVPVVVAVVVLAIIAPLKDEEGRRAESSRTKVVDADDLYADIAAAVAKWGRKEVRVKMRVDDSIQSGNSLFLYHRGPGK
ncbi:hypothetical protein J0H58_28850 [bacterium]|nr:hypothetical protein [bacterium]